MKRSILILICLLSSVSWAQDTLGVQGVDNGLTITLKCSATKSRPDPMFVFFAGNKRLLVDDDFRTRHIDFFGLINPASIKKMKTIKESEAVDKYGDYGNIGVVEIWLRRRALKNLPLEIVAEFEPVKN